MALKLYEEEKIRAIAEKIREKADETTKYTTSKMPSGIDAVYEQGYSNGYDAGVSAGGGGGSEDLEALGALCEWQVMTDTSSIATVTVVNLHPTYYLRCHIYADNSQVDYDDFVVDPESSASVTFSDNAFSQIQPIYVDNVRWTADA